jgi:hypothetical protein
MEIEYQLLSFFADLLRNAVRVNHEQFIGQVRN